MMILIFTASVQSTQPPTPAQEQESPSKEGFSDSGLVALEAFLADAGSSSMLILKDGEEVFRWGSVEKRHVIHSMRKPLISALYGKYIAAGVIDVDSTLAQNNINDIAPALSEQELSASVSDLLKSRSGVYHNAAANSLGMIQNRPVRETHLPGKHYFYNNWDFNVLGALLEQKTGKSVFTLFLEDIALPLGMAQYQGQYTRIDGEDDNAKIPTTDGFYQYETSKSQFPAYHFRMSALDLAKFGQLYLNKGKWAQEQIIPSQWIEQSTQPYSVFNPKYGIAYGMMWFVLMETETREHRAFYHTGNGVHFLGVYPHSNVVIVHRVDTEKAYRFTQQDFYVMINKVWGAYGKK
jgi:CubicO group peptidase (beta-lactamase class C family)